jgi:hypothetical protein
MCKLVNGLAVSFANAIIDPNAVVVHVLNARVAFAAML